MLAMKEKNLRGRWCSRMHGSSWLLSTLCWLSLHLLLLLCKLARVYAGRQKKRCSFPWFSAPWCFWIGLSNSRRVSVHAKVSLNQLHCHKDFGRCWTCTMLLMNLVEEARYLRFLFASQCNKQSLQVGGFKLSSLEHLSALKSYDGKTTLAQLMVQQVFSTISLLFAHILQN